MTHMNLIERVESGSGPAAYAEVMGGKVLSVRMDKSRCTEPLYLATALEARAGDAVTVEDIARMICPTDPDRCVSGSGGTHQPMVCHRRAWEDHLGAARAVLALLSPEGK